MYIICLSVSPLLCSFVFYAFLEFFNAKYSYLLVILFFYLHFKVVFYYLILSFFCIRSVFTVFLIVLLYTQ